MDVEGMARKKYETNQLSVDALSNARLRELVPLKRVEVQLLLTQLNRPIVVETSPSSLHYHNGAVLISAVSNSKSKSK